MHGYCISSFAFWFYPAYIMPIPKANANATFFQCSFCALCQTRTSDDSLLRKAPDKDTVQLEGYRTRGLDDRGACVRVTASHCIALCVLLVSRFALAWPLLLKHNWHHFTFILVMPLTFELFLLVGLTGRDPKSNAEKGEKPQHNCMRGVRI